MGTGSTTPTPSAGQESPTPTPDHTYYAPAAESRGDRWFRRAMDVALVVVIVAMVCLITWTVTRLDARGEYLHGVIATRQAGCDCGTPIRP